MKLSEKAKATQSTRDRVVSMEKDKITTIHIVNNKELEVIYDTISPCIDCSKERLCCGETAGCPVCDNLMTNEQYAEFEDKFKNIEEEQNLKDAVSMFDDSEPTTKQKKSKTKSDFVKKIEEKETNRSLAESYELIPIEKKNEVIKQFPLQKTVLPTKAEVDAYIDMYKHVKNKIVDKSDFQRIQGKEWMKKSGWRKFVKPFNLSVKLVRDPELPNPRIYEDGVCQDGSPNVHAEVRIIVSVTGVKCPNCMFEVVGQSIEAIGIKTKKEYWSDKYMNFGSYNRHNLVATARTRAENIGISDLVGFGEVSAEEVMSGGDTDENESMFF